MTVRSPLFVEVCCALFVVMVSFHEACVYIPPLKIELVFGSSTAADTCDMLGSCLRVCLDLPPNLYCSFISLFSFFLSPSSSDIMFFLCLLNPHETSLFFFIAHIPTHSISSISVWHMIAAVKTALILDNTHFCWLLILLAGSWNT